MAMWKQQASAPAGSWPEQNNTSVPASDHPSPPPAARFTPQQPRVEQSVFTNGITVRGEISGPEAIYIDGTIEGEINIPGERVTVGPKGIVSGTSKTPCITAREIVVLGAVRGNMVATDRLEIRANGSVMGDVSTARLKIEEGSYFQGAIDIREPELQPEIHHQEDEFELSSSRRDYAEAAF